MSRFTGAMGVQYMPWRDIHSTHVHIKVVKSNILHEIIGSLAAKIHCVHLVGDFEWTGRSNTTQVYLHFFATL